MIRVWLICFSFALAAAQRQPLVLFWPQAGIVPPGTNNFPPRDPGATAGPQVNPAGVLGATSVAVPVAPAGAPAAPPPPPAPGTRVLGPGGIPLPGVPNGVPQQPGGAPPASPGRPGTGPPSGGIIGTGPRPGEGIAPRPGEAIAPRAGEVSTSRNNDSTDTSALLVSPACAVVVTPGDINIPAAGGTFEVQGVIRPSGCKPALTSSGEWITPARNSAAPVFRFSVEPNQRSDSRLGIFVVGDQRVLLRQEGAPGLQFAVAPGSFSFRFDGERISSARTLTILSDDQNLTYTVVSAQPWLKVTPQKGSNSARKFKISVDPERLRSGRNEGVLFVSASGAPQSALRIPVSVEVPRLQ